MEDVPCVQKKTKDCYRKRKYRKPSTEPVKRYPKKIDWNKMWAKKYPIIAQYQQEVAISYYAAELNRLLVDLKEKYGYNDLDAFLVLKDILAVVWNTREKK